MPKKTQIQEIPFETFARGQRLASSNFFGSFCPAITKKGEGEKLNYNIRIKTGESWSGPNTTITWDYFNLDSTGLILNSPRGMAKKYNKKVRLLGMDQAVEDYKDKWI